MNPFRFSSVLLGATLFGAATATLPALFCPLALGATAPAATGALLQPDGEFKSEGAEAEFATKDGEPTVKATFPSGKGYPTFVFPAPADGWDLSKFQGIEVEVTNTGASSIKLGLRADNKGDWKKEPWNTEVATIKAGETRTMRVTFGKSYGNPGFALDAGKVAAIKMFAENPKAETVVEIKNLKTFGQATPVAVAAPAAATPAAAKPVAAPNTAGAMSGPLFEIDKADPTAFQTQGGARVAFVGEGADKRVQGEFPAGNGYPAFDFPTPKGGWNLSGAQGVQATVTNKGDSGLNVSLRVDNAGDWKKSPWSVENAWIKAGETKTIKVTFGKSFGGKPSYALDPSKITTLKIFADNPKKAGLVEVKDLKTFGTANGTGAATAGVTETAVAKPVVAKGEAGTTAPAIDGILLRFDDAELPKYKTNQSEISRVEQDGAPALKIEFKIGEQKYPNVALPVPKGNWNLSSFGGIKAEVFNPGTGTVRLFMRVDNPGNWKDNPWNTQTIKIPAGQSATVNLKFGENDGAPGFPLDAARVSAMQFFLEKPKTDTTIILKDFRAFGSPQAGSSALSSPADRDVPVLPAAWVGQKPPVEGNWVQTLNENFDGPTLNDKIWSPETWWSSLIKGQTQRYSRDNLSFEDGVLKMKLEKRRGHQYDDPKLPKMDYTTGHIVTYDKWRQKYGYFEARIKLPTARGLWPAFWMMPDRGPEAGPEGWKREDTKKGGMEIDILEHLTEWGPGRNNVAVHWDGYDKDHQSWGTSNIYFGPTPDGWHNFGVLWEPGKLTWYIDGIKKAEYENERVGSIPAYLLLNVQMGSWATKDVDVAKLPDYYQIDYVRAWQLKDRVN